MEKNFFSNHLKSENFVFTFLKYIAPCAYMPEKVVLDHIPSYVFHKSVLIQPQGYIKCVTPSISYKLI